MSPPVWITLLLAVGLVLVVLEVFVPSGGVLGLLAALAMLAGIVTAFFEQGLVAGLAVLAGAFVAVPVVLACAFRWFPATPLGRRVLPPPPAADDVLPDAGERRRLRGLVGHRGRTASELVPWGSVEVDGEPIAAVSDEGPIAPDREVDVVGVQGRALVVRVRAVVPPPAGAPASPAPGPAPPGLSSVLEEFDFEEVRHHQGPPDPLDPPSAANQA